MRLPWLVAAVLDVCAWWSNGAQGTTVGPPVQIGTTSSNSLREASGIVGSASMPGNLWMHNDSGDVARFLSVASDGTLLGQYSLSGATNIDWEDIALGPKPGGGSYLYLGDVGDNDKLRSAIKVHRTTEPTSPLGGVISTADYQTALLQYPQGARNAESLMVDPWTSDIYIVTKNPAGQIYRASASVFDQPGQTSLLEFMGNLNVVFGEPSAADISPDGLHILVRSRTSTAYLWERKTGQSVWEAMQTTPIPVSLASETQGEAIGWAADGSGFYTTSEWSSAGPRPIYFYAVSVPEPSTWVMAFIGLAGAIVHGRRRLVPGR